MALLASGCIQLPVRSGSSGPLDSGPKASGPCRTFSDRSAGTRPATSPGWRGAEEWCQGPGRERAERVAVGQDRGADPARVAAEHDLADRPAGVVALYVAEAADRTRARAEMIEVLDQLIAGITA